MVPYLAYSLLHVEFDLSMPSILSFQAPNVSIITNSLYLTPYLTSWLPEQEHKWLDEKSTVTQLKVKPWQRDACAPSITINQLQTEISGGYLNLGHIYLLLSLYSWWLFRNTADMIHFSNEAWEMHDLFKNDLISCHSHLFFTLEVVFTGLMHLVCNTAFIWIVNAVKTFQQCTMEQSQYFV